MVKKQPANAGDIRDASLIPESERFPEEGMQPIPVSLPGESPGQESGRLQSLGLQRIGHD